MLNYKKSWISVAATLALASSVVSAGYLPLSKTSGNIATTNDGTWIMFGVSGFHSESAAGVSTAGEWGILGTVRNTATDDTYDDLYGSDGLGNEENGMYVGGDVHRLLGKAKIVNSGVGQVEVRVNTAGIEFSETDPERTIYVANEDSEDRTVLFAFTYRAALEGKTLQYSTSSNAENPQVREITINSQNSFDNPAPGVLTQPDDLAEGSNLATIASVLDFDFSDNPVDYTNYKTNPYGQQAVDIDVDEADQPYASFYSYDAQNAQWNLFDSRNNSNDFSEFVKGKGYWGQVETTNGYDLESGLILGRSSITQEEYAAAGITEGWNLLAFDAQSADIRVSSTGMVFTPVATEDITIYDASGVFSTDAITMSDPQDLDADALAINTEIHASKEAGRLPRTFELYAVVSGTDLVLISNEKFIIGADSDIAATTLADNPAVDATTTTNLATTADTPAGIYDFYFQSVYDEFALVLEGTANANALFEICDVDGDASAVATATCNRVSTSAIGALPADYEVYDLGTIDGKDLQLVALDKPFYVKDHTFTRVFDYTQGTTTNEVTLVQVNGATLVSEGDTSVATATLYAADLDADGGIFADANTFVVATSDATPKVAIFTTNEESAAFYVLETDGEDVLTPSTSTEVEAQGAISSVYSINELVKSTNFTRPLVTVPVLNTATGDIADGDTITIAIDGMDDIVYTHSSGTLDVDDVNDNLITFGAVVARINEILGAGSAVLTTNDADTANIVITITHPDVKGISAITYASASASGTVATLTLDSSTTTPQALEYTLRARALTNDLKYNAIYTPNYVMNGPLYTLKELGYKPRGMVSGITNIDTTTRVKWDSVDLTRDPSEWLSAQEYDLFAVDYMGGYWVYLEQDTNPVTLSVENPEIASANYTQHFNDPDGDGVSASYNSFNGNFTVTIPELDGLDRTSVRVQAKLADTNIELQQSSGSSTAFEGAFYASELAAQLSGLADITLRATDGVGYSVNYPAVAGEAGVPVDMQKPATPSVTFVDGANLAISSTSDDVAKFFVYKEAKVPAALSDEPAMKLTPAEAATTNICADMDYGDSTDLTIFAIDGGGTRTSGNTSDAITLTGYTPMLKEVMLLENTYDGAAASITSIGAVYDDTCTAGDVALTNAGVQLSARTELTQAKLAFQPKEGVAITASPISVHLKDTAGDNIVRIDFESEYAGETVYVQIGTKVYSYELPAAGIAEGAAVVPTEIVGQTL